MIIGTAKSWFAHFFFWFLWKKYCENCTPWERQAVYGCRGLLSWEVARSTRHALKNSNLYVLFLCSRHKVTKILTFCIVFQFESSWCAIPIRVKMKEELVAWRDFARWCGITIFSNHWRCHWTSIIYGQFVQAETNTYFIAVF